MPQLRYFTAGESHGQCLIGVLDGLPAGLKIDLEAINRDLARRQKGYGRGGRMKIETDQAEILSGIRHGESIGSPLTLISRSTNYRP
jgi:chorismate synthase